MALKTNTTGRFACNYWHARNIDYDKGDNLTRVNLGGYVDADDREETYPVARDARIVTLEGAVSLDTVYDALKTLPEWADAEDC